MEALLRSEAPTSCNPGSPLDTPKAHGAARRDEAGAALPASLPESEADSGSEGGGAAPLPAPSEHERAALRGQLADGFQALLFHREVRRVPRRAGAGERSCWPQVASSSRPRRALHVPPPPPRSAGRAARTRRAAAPPCAASAPRSPRAMCRPTCPQRRPPASPHPSRRAHTPTWCVPPPRPARQTQPTRAFCCHRTQRWQTLGPAAEESSGAPAASACRPTGPHSTAPHHTAPHRTAPHRNAFSPMRPSHQCRVAEAGSSLDSIVRVYAKEASTLLLAEVEKYTRWEFTAGAAAFWSSGRGPRRRRGRHGRSPPKSRSWSCPGEAE
jgi:hypothetical protein